MIILSAFDILTAISGSFSRSTSHHNLSPALFAHSKKKVNEIIEQMSYWQIVTTFPFKHITSTQAAAAADRSNNRGVYTNGHPPSQGRRQKTTNYEKQMSCASIAKRLK